MDIPIRWVGPWTGIQAGISSRDESPSKAKGGPEDGRPKDDIEYLCKALQKVDLSTERLAAEGVCIKQIQSRIC